MSMVIHHHRFLGVILKSFSKFSKFFPILSEVCVRFLVLFLDDEDNEVENWDKLYKCLDIFVLY